VLVNFVEQYWHQARLPVMTVNNIRVFVALQHELQRRSAKKRKPLIVIGLPIKCPSVEKVMGGMWFDKETFTPVNKSEIDSAMNRRLIPGHPKILIRYPQIVDLVVTQTIVLG